jgi:hypothetical protein
MTKKHYPPMPEKLPPVRPELAAQFDAVYARHLERFEDLFETPEFKRLLGLLGDNKGPTGIFVIDRYRAGKKLMEACAGDPNVTFTEVAEFAAFIEADLHTRGMSGEQRGRAGAYKH